MLVPKYLQERNIGRRSAIDHEVIEHFKLLHWPGSETHDLFVPLIVCFCAVFFTLPIPTCSAGSSGSGFASLLQARRTAFERLPAGLVDLRHQYLAAGLLDGFPPPLATARARARATTTDAKAGTVSFLGRYGAVDGACESHAEVDPDAFVDHAIHGRAVIGKVEIGEKAEGAKSKWQYRRDNLLAAHVSMRFSAILWLSSIGQPSNHLPRYLPVESSLLGSSLLGATQQCREWALTTAKK
jgi:hypothetical protein